MSTHWIRRLRNWMTLTPLRTVIAGALSLALLVGAGIGAYSWVSHDHARAVARAAALAARLERCGPGVEHRGPRRDRECIGVTDGSYEFARQLVRVERAIHRQDHLISGQLHATIALLMPLTSADPGMQNEILHAIQGAYVAQYRANADITRPKIRLVLANPGVDSNRWGPVVRRLEGMTGAPDNLRVVFGISVSTRQTEAEVHALTSRGIPVVTGATTADDFANSPTAAKPAYPGLARVSPTDSQEAAALEHFGNINPKSAILVEDTRKGDNYITTLANAFAKNVSPSSQLVHEFTSARNISQAGDTGNTFMRLNSDICESDARWIYFAGRQAQLSTFIDALDQRGCRSRKFTIVTGSAASNLVGDLAPAKDAFTTGNITLDFAAIASPGAWSGAHPATGGSTAGYQNLSGTLVSPAIGPIGPASLTDGQAIINYDAALTAISGIRDAVDPQTPMPSRLAISRGWGLLNGDERVAGASGWICLDNAGNPYDKAVPIVQYRDSASPSFAAPGWPAGRPPAASCIPPGG